MRIIFNLIVCLALATLHVSCDEVFEPSIENKAVSIVAPGDSVVSPTYAVTFWWNPLENALKYNLQIVSPNFNNATAVVLDTMVTSTKFTYSLNPGAYQWRIRGENGSTQTSYVTRILIVDTSGLSSQPLYVNAPAHNIYSNSYSVPFTWQPLYGTTGYKIEIDTITGNFSGTLKCNQSTPFNGYTFNFGNDGVFQWRVKAVNATEQSAYSGVRTIYIDRTKPLAVGNLYPMSGTLSMPLSFTWDACASPDVLKYKLFVYNGADTSVFSQDLNPRVIYTGTSFSFNAGIAGNKMLWRVKAVDKAGNESDFSPYGSFIIGL